MILVLCVVLGAVIGWSLGYLLSDFWAPMTGKRLVVFGIGIGTALLSLALRVLGVI